MRKSRRDWYSAGGEVVKNESDRKRIEKTIAGLDWRPFPSIIPLIASEGIRAALKDLELPAPDAVAISEDVQPAVYGIQCQYVNGTLRLYILDRMDYAKLGSRILIPLCGDWTPNQIGQAVGGDL